MHEHRPDRHVELRSAAGLDEADRACVDTSRRRLDAGDDFHRARLRCAGDRRRRKQGAHHIDERCIRLRRDRRRQLQDGRIALDVEQVRDPHAAGARHAPQIVPDHVDDHHVLGALLVGLTQASGVLDILFEPQPARSRALHGARFDPIAGAMKEELRRGTADRPFPCIYVRPERRGLSARELQEQRVGIRLQLRPQPIGVIDLIRVAVPNQLLEFCEHSCVLVGRDTRRPRFFRYAAGCRS